MKDGIVYGIKYLPENKVIYVGCTTWLARRIYQHKILRDDRRNQPIQIFIHEKGVSNFEFVELFKKSVTHASELFEKEAEFIELYDTYNVGFNSREHGTHTPESNENPNARKIKCVNTGEVFLTIQAACQKYGFSLSEMSSHLTKKRYTNGIGKRKVGESLFFEYVDRTKDNRVISEETSKKMSKRVSESNKKKVINLDTGEVYETLKDAALKLGVNYTNLSSFMSGNEKIKKTPLYANLNLKFIQPS